MIKFVEAIATKITARMPHAWHRGIREQVSFTKGRIIVRGKLVSRGKAKRADYILYYKSNMPLENGGFRRISYQEAREQEFVAPDDELRGLISVGKELMKSMEH